MCGVAEGIAAAAALAGAYGQYEEGKAQASAARAQADAARQNARIENKRQEMIADKYAQEDLRRRAQLRLNAGTNRANAGSAGLDIGGSSSVLDILTSSQEAYRQDKMNSLTNQRNENWMSRQNEANYLTQASAYDAQADNARRIGNIGAISTILGGAASIYGNVGKGSGSKKAGGKNNFYSGTTDVNAYTNATFSPGKGITFGKKNYNYRDSSASVLRR